jgi:hypothetical protein
MTDTASSELQRKVQELSDRSEIKDLVGKLGLLLDEKRVEDLAQVFVEEATGRFPAGGFASLDELKEYGRSTIPAFDDVQHLITNTLISLDGDSASARSNMLSFNTHRGGDPTKHFDLGAVYQFQFVRTADGWRISRVELAQVWTGGSMDEEWLANAKYDGTAA